uniref:Uncharacterized protein n=1 Tax=Triticum urartu TaxID=4572 RepID=A0A8R7TIE4_TRIUA
MSRQNPCPDGPCFCRWPRAGAGARGLSCSLSLSPLLLAAPSSSSIHSLVSDAPRAWNVKTALHEEAEGSIAWKSQPWRSHVMSTGAPPSRMRVWLPRKFHRSRRSCTTFRPSTVTHASVSPSSPTPISCSAPDSKKRAFVDQHPHPTNRSRRRAIRDSATGIPPCSRST